jgi:hypothetical protein
MSSRAKLEVASRSHLLLRASALTRGRGFALSHAIGAGEIQ